MQKFFDKKVPRADPPLAMHLEQMMKEHLDAVMAIEQSFKAPWTRRMFMQELQKPAETAASYVALDDENRLLGYVLFWFVADEVHVVNIAVHPRVRRQGLGRYLMHEVLDSGKQMDMLIVTLEVRVHNKPATALYEGLGFNSVAIRKNYYADNHEDALVMVKYLNSAE